MKNWKTTLCGVIVLTGTLLPQFFGDIPMLTKLGGFLAALGTGLGFVLCKDHDNDDPTGGDAPQPVPISQAGLITRLTSPSGATMLLLAGLLAPLLLLSGCQMRPGQSHPVSREQMQAALLPVGAGAVRRAILNSPEHADATADYARAVSEVFCGMSDTSQFDPTFLILALDTATANMQDGVDPLVIDAKNALIAIYRIAWADRYRAELPPEGWLKFTADFVCASIRQGLRDAGQSP